MAPGTAREQVLAGAGVPTWMGCIDRENNKRVWDYNLPDGASSVTVRLTWSGSQIAQVERIPLPRRVLG